MDLELVPMPEVIRIEPASSCNFKCIHCPTGLDMNPHTGIMSEETFSEILRKIQHLHFRVAVLYHGGEPLLNPRFPDMIRRLRPLASFIKTVTNGSILTERKAREIIEAGIDQVEISIDGRTPEENDRIRIRSRSEKTIEAVKTILRLKRELGIEKPAISVGNVQIPDDQTDTTQKPEVPEFLKEAFAGDLDHITFRVYHALVWANMLNTGSGHPETNYCDHLIHTVTIRHNGDVVPCCYDITSSMVMGNILHETLERIWNNAAYRKMRKDIHTFQPPSPCQNCLVLHPSRQLKTYELHLR